MDFVAPRTALLLALSLAATSCAGPDAHRKTTHADDAAPRPTAAAVLASDDPLAAQTNVAPAEEDAGHHHHHHGAAPTEAVDPVCGMTVDPATAKGGSAEVDGKTYFFCSSGCRKAFLDKHGGHK